MSTPVFTIRATATLARAEDVIRQRDVSALAVVDDEGALVGVVSLADLLHVSEVRGVGKDRTVELVMPSRKVEEIMTREVLTVGPVESIGSAAQLMWEQRIHRVFVASDDELHGVFSARDVMQSIGYRRIPGMVSQLMSEPLRALESGVAVHDAIAQLASEPVSGLVVLEDGHAIGVFGQEEALIAKHLGSSTTVDSVMSPALCTVPAETQLFRAAQQASVMNVRRIVVERDGTAVGAVSGLEFCRCIAQRAGAYPILA